MSLPTDEDLNRAIAHIGNRHWLIRLLHYPVFFALVGVHVVRSRFGRGE
jgi:hypothetical protein